ncbi:hypothetical protein GKIL_2356 [Gloeobacter kilaueensis JS1]|uniref:CRISPR type III-associated protein domain-containing protein n=2 Tax=Gloeobacter TaxID=33071 RepID=U5QHZ9_GLOK1|nr:hypothetical protein GKIL_2356 [Gloeobacter kilaueensis JS1]
MLSDWHVGAGYGRPGDIDRLVRRDHEDLPFLPAKTLTGIWRDGCELVACGLDDGNKNGPWSRWVEYLFGDQPALAEQASGLAPVGAALSVRPARLDPALRRVLTERRALLEGLTFVKPGVAIDAATGTAKDDFLRFEEMVRQGAVLQAECSLNAIASKKGREVALALLAAGAKMVERLGGKRRRGNGRCEFTLHHPETEGWLAVLESTEDPGPPPEPMPWPPADGTAADEPTSGGSWQRLVLNIEARTPLVIAARTVGNVVETLDYIPGTLLLPIVSRRLQQLGVPLGAAIVRGDLVVTPATLAVNKERGQPVPNALFERKGSKGFEQEGNLFNRFEENIGGQLKGCRAGYLGRTDAAHLPVLGKISLRLQTHNTVADDRQRPDESVGGVYSYEAIPAGTRFLAELRLRTELAERLKAKQANWSTLLGGTERVGQAKKDDYGQIQISCAGKFTPFPARSEQPSQAPSTLTVWLLSDLLLRDERLRPSTTVETLRSALEAELGVKLLVEGESAFTRQRRTESWHTRWNLPRPSLAGLQAGSCVRFSIKDGQIRLEDLTRLEAGGLGERRAEGYGQLSFDDPLLSTKLSELTALQEQASESPKNKLALINAQNHDLYAYARQIEQEVWRANLRRVVLAVAASPEKRKDLLGFSLEDQGGKPPSSQLGALRSVLVACARNNLELFNQWRSRLENSSNHRERWPECSLERLSELVNDPARIWQVLSGPESEGRLSLEELVCTSDGLNRLKNELRFEAVRMLVDACIRAHRREVEQQEETPHGS